MNRSYNEEEWVTKLKNRDDTVLALLYEHFAEALYNFFIQRFSLEPSVLRDVICDALINLSQNPQKYDASRSSLKTFVYRDVEGDIKNKLESLKRPKNKIYQNLVELNQVLGNKQSVKHSNTEMEQSEIAKAIKNFFGDTFPDETDQEVAWMMKVEKIKDTETYAALLNAADLPKEEKEALVKRCKDRINVQLKRKGWEAFQEKMKRNV